jgi:hypothetical protein
VITPQSQIYGPHLMVRPVLFEYLSNKEAVLDFFIA